MSNSDRKTIALVIISASGLDRSAKLLLEFLDCAWYFGSEIDSTFKVLGVVLDGDLVRFVFDLVVFQQDGADFRWGVFSQEHLF